MVKAAIVLAAVLAAAGCASATDPADEAGAPQVVSAGDTVRLRIGETAAVGVAGVRIQFRSVVADSRCPIDALCVWAGDAHIKVKIFEPGTEGQSYDLHTYDDPKSVDYGAYRFKLVEVGPARVSTSQPKPEDYFIRIEIAAR